MKFVINNKQSVFFLYLIISLFVSAFNVFFVNNMLLAMLLVVFEVFILLVSLLKKNLTNYLAFYTIFIANCIEFSAFLGNDTFYNLKNFRVLGLNLGAWILLPAVFFVLTKPLQIKEIKNRFYNFYFFTKYLLLLNLVAAIVGFLLILFDDNHISVFVNVFFLYFVQAFQMLFLPLMIGIIVFHILLYTPKDLYKLSFALEVTLWGSIFQLVLSLLFNIYGYYGTINTLLASNLTFLTPFIILLSIDVKNIMYPKVNFTIGIIGTILVFLYNSNGKHFLIFLVVAVAFAIFFMQKKTSFYRALVVLSVVLITFALPVVISLFSEQSIIFSSKFSQAFSIISIFSEDWFSNLPGSPKVRIVEIINIIIEFTKKPWLFITGKGYLGSIKDHIQMFTGYLGSFSYEEWINNTFFNLHEIASQLLIYGFFGIWYSYKLLLVITTHWKENIWLFIAGMWYLVLYGYSFTLSAFCIVVFYYSLSAIDKIKT